jgi:selenocysteine lyase/cysteine desulfurase
MTITPAAARREPDGPPGRDARSYDVESLRASEFPWAARGDAIYLNNGSTGPLPRRTVEALADFNERRAAPYLITDEVQFGTLRRSRELIARLINARPQDIALMVNTSYGINLAARALPIREGDVIVTNDREFPANIYPWMALGAKGVSLERVPCIDGLPDEEALLRALDRPRVKVLATSWVSFATGYRVDLARIGQACRERGIYFVVDAIQGLGALTLDLARTPVDILACGAQKWLLSPWGTGFVYVRPELVQALEPQAVGWMSTRASENFASLVDYDLTYLPDARRFEVITVPFQDFSGLNASLELLFELGPTAVSSHVADLAARIVDWVAARPDVTLITPASPDRRAGIVTLRPRDTSASAARLDQAGVVFSLREGGIRLSPHCYNTREEVDAALAVLDG